MINFFRKIRQQLLTENKFSKYLIYAIGEIVLVVIGILIALSINNWNEGLKQERLKQQLYTELRASIMSDTAQYNKSIRRLKSVLFNAKHLKEKNSIDAPYSSDLDSSFAKIQLIKSFDALYAIFDRIMDVGIEIMDDNNLKNIFLHYYEDSKMFTTSGERARELLAKIYPKYFISHDFGVSAVPEDFEQLKRVNEYKIALDYCIESSNDLIEKTNHRKKLAVLILEMLNNQITLNKTQLENMPYVKSMTNETL